MKAIVLFSGGLDSTTVLYQARSEGYEVQALTLQYGQLHVREIESAKKIASLLEIQHEVLQLNMPWKGSSLVDPELGLPKNRSVDEMETGIPSTYVPARNTLFLSYALSWAEVAKADSVWIGANAIDYSGYPDCRPDFLEAMENVYRLGTKQGREGKPIQIKAPLVEKTKSDIVKLALSLNVPLELTWSCYQGDDKPCEECDSCLLRAKGFEEAKVKDPLRKLSSQT